MKPDADSQDFVHPQLGREITAIGGHYVFDKEIRMPYGGRKILYFVGYAVLDSTCCAYVLVAGFIKQWKYKKGPDNCYISKMAPVLSHSVQKDIRKLIQKKEMVFQITFNSSVKLTHFLANFPNLINF